MYHAAGYQPSGGYPRPIYYNTPLVSTQCVVQDMDLSYLLYPIPHQRSILWDWYLPAEYEVTLSNWKALGTNGAEYPIGRSYRLVSGPIRTPPGGYPIHRIRRQMADDGIG